MRFSKYVLIGLIIFIVVYIIYFASNISAFYEPIKTYQFGLHTNEIQRQSKDVINTMPNTSFWLTDSIGPKDTRSYHYDLLIQNDSNEYMFVIIFQNNDYFWDRSVKSEIKLVGAFDKKLRTGGYKIEDRDVDKLINFFEIEFIKRLTEKNTSR